MAALVVEFVTKHLPEVNLEFLTALCEEYRIVVADEKKDKKPELLKLVLRYLSSEQLEQTPDKGVGVFLKLYNELGDQLGALKPKHEEAMPPLEGDETNEDAAVKTDEKVAPSPAGGRGVAAESVETLSYHKLRLCKIHGKIGDPDDADTLSYTDLAFQMKENSDNGYTDGEIYAAIIRATKPGNSLRELLEIKGEMDKDELITVLKSHFGDEEPESILQLLRKCRQKKNETAYTFFSRAIGLKDKALLVQAGNFGKNLVRDVFFKTLYTGLKQNNIRMELHHLLKEKTVSDPQLLKAVREACANETIRLEKLNEEKANHKANINNVNACDSDSAGSSRNTPPETSSRDSDSSACSEKPPKGKGNKGKKTGGNASQNNNQNNNQNKSQNFDELIATVNKVASQVTQLTTTNAVFQGQINELQQHMKGVAGKPLNVHVPAFAPGQRDGFVGGGAGRGRGAGGAGRGRGGGNVYHCPTCVAQNARFCNHCWYCGATTHKSYECQQKNC